MEVDNEDKEVIIPSTLSALVDAALSIEKVRVRSQVRETHLELNDRSDEETKKLVAKLLEIESYIDGRVARHIKSHPDYNWFSRVKGVGKENIGKVVAQIDIRKCATISALWKYCGYSVDQGHALRREKGGGTLTYNSRLRSMCWRLGGSLLKATGKFYTYYIEQKRGYVEHYEAVGIKIVTAASLPKDKRGKKYEPEGVISEGHVHNRALRKMIKLFLACLWLTWREAEGLPITKPYAIEKLGHNSFIDPWEMIDR